MADPNTQIAHGEGLRPHESNPISVEDDVKAAMDAAEKAAEPDPGDEPENEAPESEDKEVLDFNKAKDAVKAKGEPEETPPESGAPAEDAADPLDGVVAGDLEPPAEWDADQQDIFRTVDKKTQEFLLSVETQAASRYQEQITATEPLRRAQEQWAPYLNRRGIPMEKAVDSLFSTEMTLATGTPAQKREVIESLIKTYGVEFGQAPALPDEVSDDPVASAVNAQLAQVMERLEGLSGRVDSRFSEMQTNQQAAAQSQLDTFANTKDEKGALLHPYFAEVRPIMEAIAQSEMAAGRQTTIEDVYQQACRASQTVWPKIQSAERAAGLRERQKAAAEKKRAASSVSSSPSGARGQKDDGRPDETVEETVRREYAKAVDAG